MTIVSTDSASKAIPWAMPLVARVERDSVFSHTDLCTAAAKSVLFLLSDKEAVQNKEWKSAIDSWLSGPIRKVVRRARASKWHATDALIYRESTYNGTTVRAFLPCLTSNVPIEIIKLQVSNLQLPNFNSGVLEKNLLKNALTIFLNPELQMSTGKAAAQAGHAAQLSFKALSNEKQTSWKAEGFPLVVALPSKEEFAKQQLTASVSITDAGFTEVPPGSLTAVASFK